MAKTNSEILNKIREESSTEYQRNIPEATDTNQNEVLMALQSFPTQMNEFINTLTNRIVLTKFMNKMWSNKLSELHGGKITYGKGIQFIKSGLAERKGFDENFGDTPEASLIRPTKQQVEEQVITENFKFKYKISVNDEELRGAFLSQYGLSGLIETMMTGLYNKAYLDEYDLMKGILTRKTSNNSGGDKTGEGVISLASKDAQLKNTVFVKLPKGFSSNLLAEKIQAQTEKMTFLTENYNLAKMHTHSEANENVIFTTPDYKAKLNVETLAFAFNIDKAKLPSKIITIDEFDVVTIDSVNYNVVAVIAEKTLVQQHDTIYTMKRFDNGDNLTTNYWLHRHGVSAYCKFSQLSVIVEPVE